MSSTKPVTEPISVNRNYRSEALKPGGVVMNANFIVAGASAYGELVGHLRLQQSGVKPPGDDVGDFIVKGTYAFLGGKPGEVIHISFNSIPPTVFGEQTINGQMSLQNDWKTGHASFSYTAKGGHPLFTVHNVKVNLVS
jgi:hypothetical protein